MLPSEAKTWLWKKKMDKKNNAERRKNFRSQRHFLLSLSLSLHLRAWFKQPNPSLIIFLIFFLCALYPLLYKAANRSSGRDAP
jgi:hypothetical protein